MELNVLLVEDNAELLEAHSTILEVLSIPYVAACTGQEALELACSQSFSLILSDISMPQGDGLWLLRKVRASKGCSANALFYLSSGYTEWSEEKLVEEGATGLLRKPYDLMGFLQKLKNRP